MTIFVGLEGLFILGSWGFREALLSPKNMNYVIVEGFIFLNPFPISKGSMNVHTYGSVYIYLPEKSGTPDCFNGLDVCWKFFLF